MRDRRSALRPEIAVAAPVKRSPDSPTLRVVAETGYLRGVEIAGGTPVLLSPALGSDTVRGLLEEAGGVVLTGGEDVDPARYGEHNAGARNVSPERDSLEFEVAEWALERGVPLLAICRGMQLLNVVLGGNLFQDLSSQREDTLDHDRDGSAVSREVHSIRVEGVSLLSGVFPGESFRTNSTHHQGVRELGDGLVPVARAEDGVVEAVEYRNEVGGGWTVGVQWHPERMLDERTGTNRRLFQRFGQAVAEYLERRG